MKVNLEVLTQVSFFQKNATKWEFAGGPEYTEEILSDSLLLSTLGESETLSVFIFSLGDITTETVSSNSFSAFQLQVEREGECSGLP